MNKVILRVCSVLLLCATLPSYAALILNGTRYIYEEGTSRKQVTITNNSEDKMGAQIWIESYDDVKGNNLYTGEGHFTASPSLIKIDSKKKVQVNLVNIIDDLPKDHESIYWLNVQEIPQKSDVDAPAVVFAQRIKVKLIYRPKGLGERYEAENKQLVLCDKGNVRFENDTGFIFSPLSYSIEGKKTTFTNVLLPGETVLSDTGKSCPEKISLELINDFGGIKNVDFKVKGKITAG
ncbi:fimbrial biogenesis chaperone [Vibrio hepatarius]|uniref:fimbrial biogenesis chaperone n=1 Tax=Vibrio hepatarius TaxID=171383 RepID=UPI001C083675|nr:fimbria/pilus periplasmic chaperone [Vibrio hepatarius]